MLQEIIEMLDSTVLTNGKRSLPANFYSAIDRRLAMFTQRRMALNQLSPVSAKLSLSYLESKSPENDINYISV